MPIVNNSSFKPAFPIRNGHLQTLYTAAVRKVNDVNYKRERVNTPDNDFLDLDWSKVGCNKLAILSHGLEGSSSSSYMCGMTRAFNKAGYDVLAWNYRGCSGEPNKTIKMYHSGATYDLQTVIKHAEHKYQEISLIGFSLGANLTLLYLGEQGNELNCKIKSAVAFSCPCDLRSSTKTMETGIPALYQKHFISNLKKTIYQKHKSFSDQIDIDGLDQIKTFFDYDDKYIAKIHGYKGALDYWEKCSCINKLENIKIPSLIVNAKDDSILGEECYPFDIARAHDLVFLEAPAHGGHVGFVDRIFAEEIWSERRAVEFVTSVF